MTKSKKTFEFFFIGICAGGIVIGTAMLIGAISRGASKSPTLFETHYDYGNLFPKQMIKHTFQVSNPFGEVLLVSQIKRTCGCIAFKLGTSEIPPNGKTTLDLLIKAPDEPGEAKLSTLVTTQGQRTNRKFDFIFVIDAQLARVIEIQDSLPFIKIGQFRSEDTPVKKTFLVTRGKHPMQWDTLQCQSNNECIDSNVKRIEPDKWILELTLKDVGNIGYIRGKLEFFFFREKELLPYRLTKRVEGQLLGPVQAEPSSLLFGVVHAGEKVRKTIRLTNATDCPAAIKIISVKPSDPNRIKAEIIGHGTEQNAISVVFSADDKKGRYQGLIVIQAELDELYELRTAYAAYVVD